MKNLESSLLEKLRKDINEKRLIEILDIAIFLNDGNLQEECYKYVKNTKWQILRDPKLIKETEIEESAFIQILSEYKKEERESKGKDQNISSIELFELIMNFY